jgi:hypothetical protein
MPNERIALFGGDVKVSGSATFGSGSGTVKVSGNDIAFTDPTIRVTRSGSHMVFFDANNQAGRTLSSFGSGGSSSPGNGYAQYHDNTFSPVALWQLSGTYVDSAFGHTQAAVGTSRFARPAPDFLAAYFDGSTMLVPTSSVTPRLTLTGSATVECICFINQYTAAQVIWAISGITGDVNGNENALFQCNVEANGTLSYFAEFAAGTNISYTTTNVIPFGRLFHLAATRTSAGVVSFFVDGELVGTSGALTLPTTGSTGTSSARVTIGAFPDSFSSPQSTIQKGHVASFKVVDRQLTEAEVRSEYKKTLGMYHGGSSTNVQLGGNYGKFRDITAVSTTTSTQSTAFSRVGMFEFNPALITSAGGGNRTINMRVIAETTGPAAEVRLYNVSTNTPVTGSLMSTTSLTPTLLTSPDLSAVLSAGSAIYEIQMRKTGGSAFDTVNLGYASLRISWT